MRRLAGAGAQAGSAGPATTSGRRRPGQLAARVPDPVGRAAEEGVRGGRAGLPGLRRAPAGCGLHRGGGGGLPDPGARARQKGKGPGRRRWPAWRPRSVRVGSAGGGSRRTRGWLTGSGHARARPWGWCRASTRRTSSGSSRSSQQGATRERLFSMFPWSVTVDEILRRTHSLWAFSRRRANSFGVRLSRALCGLTSS